MRIATWNLERGGRTRAARAAQEERLREVAADVIVLTEPPATYRERAGVVASPARRAGGESWIAIVGANVESLAFEIPYERLAVAARVGGLIVYGGGLPWLAVTKHAPDLVLAGETSLDAFARVLAEQLHDVDTLARRFGKTVVWAGDFNQTLTGPLTGGSRVRRKMLSEGLASIGYSAWNADDAHAIPAMRSIDLICGPSDMPIVGRGRIDPRREAIVMSDHAGYWVDL